MPTATQHPTPHEAARERIEQTFHEIDGHINDIDSAAKLLFYVSHTTFQIEPGNLHLLSDVLERIGTSLRADVEVVTAGWRNASADSGVRKPHCATEAALMDACRRWEALHQAYTKTADGALGAARWAVSDEIATMEATTQAGRQAKARIAVELLRENRDDDPADSDTSFAMAVLRELAEGGRAAR